MLAHSLWHIAFLVVAQPQDPVDPKVITAENLADSFRVSLHRRLQTGLDAEHGRIKKNIESKRYAHAATAIDELRSPHFTPDTADHKLEIGTIVRMSEQNTEVFQVLPPDRALVDIYGVAVMLKDVSRLGLVDKARYPRFEYAYICGTTTYESAMGGPRTCLLAQVGDSNLLKQVVVESDEVFLQKRQVAARELGKLLERTVAATIELDLRRSENGLDIAIRNQLGIRIDGVTITIESNGGNGSTRDLVLDFIAPKRSVVRTIPWSDKDGEPIAKTVRAYPSVTPCTACNGTRKSDCRACNGSGRIRVKKGESATCNKCKGQGKIACTLCE